MKDLRRDFEKDAALWDENPSRVKLADDVAKAIREEAALNREMDVLDFGCGTGLVTLQLQPFVRSITGADSSHGMLAVLWAKIERQRLANVSTRRLDIEKGDRLEGRYHFDRLQHDAPSHPAAWTASPPVLQRGPPRRAPLHRRPRPRRGPLPWRQSGSLSFRLRPGGVAPGLDQGRIHGYPGSDGGHGDEARRRRGQAAIHRDADDRATETVKKRCGESAAARQSPCECAAPPNSAGQPLLCGPFTMPTHSVRSHHGLKHNYLTTSRRTAAPRSTLCTFRPSARTGTPSPPFPCSDTAPPSPRRNSAARRTSAADAPRSRP